LLGEFIADSQNLHWSHTAFCGGHWLSPVLYRVAARFQVKDMTPDEAWLRVARECPRRIMDELHRCGEYQHGTAAQFPGKVLCCHKHTPLPAGWQPTPAQEHAWQAGAHLALGAVS
jgi:hypothetical protein